MHEAHDDETLHSNPPMEITDHSLEGWRLQKNRNAVEHPSQTVFTTIERAKEAAAQLCPYPLEWSVAAKDAKGNSMFIGAHPEMLENYLKNRLGSLSDEQKLSEIDSERLRSKLGHQAWWDQWYIEPEYSSIWSPVAGAIRTVPHSLFFAAPWYDGAETWCVRREGFSGEILNHLSRENAILEATRLSLGLKTNRYWQESCKQLIGCGIFLAMALAAIILNL